MGRLKRTLRELSFKFKTRKFPLLEESLDYQTHFPIIDQAVSVPSRLTTPVFMFEDEPHFQCINCLRFPQLVVTPEGFVDYGASGPCPYVQNPSEVDFLAPLWTTIWTTPEAIKDAHRKYLELL